MKLSFVIHVFLCRSIYHFDPANLPETSNNLQGTSNRQRKMDRQKSLRDDFEERCDLKHTGYTENLHTSNLYQYILTVSNIKSVFFVFQGNHTSVKFDAQPQKLQAANTNQICLDTLPQFEVQICIQLNRHF